MLFINNTFCIHQVLLMSYLQIQFLFLYLHAVNDSNMPSLKLPIFPDSFATPMWSSSASDL